jgi:hypothetical protein
MLTGVSVLREEQGSPHEGAARHMHDCRGKRTILATVSALTVAILLSLTGVPVEAQTAERESETELAIQTENPISALMRIPFQDNMHFGIGPNHRTNNELKIQPLIPIALNRDWNLITRTLFTVIKQPNLSTTNENTWGLGASQFSAFLSPAGSAPVVWGAGPIFQFPTTTDNVLGSRTWGAGPTAAVFVIEGPWALGLLANNVWSFAGNDDRPNVSQLLVQYFLNYNFDSGWYLTSSPIITANWKQSRGNKWTVPLGGGVGKVFQIGNLSFNATLQAYSNVVRPDPGPDWTLRIQFSLLLPRSMF